MASNKGTTETAPTGQKDEFADCYDMGAAPEGFRDESLPDVGGWWKAEPGLGFMGTIVGAFKISKSSKQGDRTRTVVLVKLAKPTKAVSDKKPVRLDKDAILGVSINHALLPMLNYIERQGKVWAVVKGQKDVGQPQPMWIYDLKLKGEKTAPPQLAEGSGRGEDDDIPF